MKAALPLAFVALLSACSKSSPHAGPERSTAASSTTQASAQVDSSKDVSAATVGRPAPDFTLKDLDGNEVRLSSFKGKTVVLEWFNPGCPFVKASHSKGSLKDAARRLTSKGIVWLAVNSGAPGKQGHGIEANRAAAKTFGMEHPILLDEPGSVGHAYGATNTPHLFVIDDKGVLVYRGAVDNSPDGEGESPTGGKLVSYVESALADVAAGKPVATPETKAYGCGVKYSP